VIRSQRTVYNDDFLPTGKDTLYGALLAASIAPSPTGVAVSIRGHHVHSGITLPERGDLLGDEKTCRNNGIRRHSRTVLHDDV
jgi:hypothetical protein